MQRHTAIYPLAPGHAEDLKSRMLNWASQFSILLFLDSNSYSLSHGRCECLLAAGSMESICSDNGGSLSTLQLLHNERRDWIFGHIAYDHKNTLEPRLNSRHAITTAFPQLRFFIPRTVCYIDKEQTTFTIASFDDPDGVYKAIMNAGKVVREKLPKLKFTGLTSKQEYTETVSKLRRHIADGDCYEINLCNKAYCAGAAVDPLQVFMALNALSPAPFAAFYRLCDQYVMCASPERYLQKNGNMLIAQPIKGTARRDKDATKDNQIKDALSKDLKERAENVMIVDLMRNDLARCCETGSVSIQELFGIYTFPQVHQMISTVCGSLKSGVPFLDAIRYSFPMGSMTGAPKYKVMQLTDTYELSARELFSGTVGYISPAGDFDFNVIIRSLFYNAATQYLSYHTGGAITYDSDPEKEWDEMRLKAWALESIFS